MYIINYYSASAEKLVKIRFELNYFYTLSSYYYHGQKKLNAISYLRQ